MRPCTTLLNLCRIELMCIPTIASTDPLSMSEFISSSTGAFVSIAVSIIISWTWHPAIPSALFNSSTATCAQAIQEGAHSPAEPHVGIRSAIRNALEGLNNRSSKGDAMVCGTPTEENFQFDTCILGLLTLDYAVSQLIFLSKSTKFRLNVKFGTKK